jgi:hypothetical protein
VVRGTPIARTGPGLFVESWILVDDTPTGSTDIDDSTNDPGEFPGRRTKLLHGRVTG